MNKTVLHKMISGLMSFIFVTLLMHGAVQAQDITVRATVNKNQVAVNEKFEYKLEISGKSTGNIDPQFPSFEGLNVLSGPNQSTSIQIINGAMTSSKTFSYYLYTPKEGQVIIPPVAVKAGGKTVKSNQIKITVTKAKQGTPQSRKKTPTSTDQDMLGEKLYLKALVNRKNVYQNEQVVVEYKLYFQVQVRSYNFEKIPANPGFWTEEFELPGQPTVTREIVNGVEYQVATLRKIALFPTYAGELQIEPLTVAIDALVPRKRRSRNLFDSFFDDPFGRTVRTIVSSEEITLNVKSLPTRGRPSGFEGAVGKFSMSVVPDKTNLTTNEALSLKIKISGEGNIKLAKTPELQTPPDMERYDPKERVNVNRKGNTISGTRETEYILVPRYAGEYSIKPVSFAYFDPKARKYKTITSGAINLNVAPGADASGSIVSSGNLSKQEVELLGEDIRYIKEETRFIKSDRKIYQNPLYYAGFVIPLLIVGFSWYQKKQMDKLASNAGLARKRRAGKIASRHLHEARKIITKNPDKFYNVMSKALQGFVSDKLNIDMTDFTASSVQKELENVGVVHDEIKEYQVCLEESDYRQFAGSSSTEAEMRDFYERARKILTKLEKYI